MAILTTYIDDFVIVRGYTTEIERMIKKIMAKSEGQDFGVLN